MFSVAKFSFVLLALTSALHGVHAMISKREMHERQARAAERYARASRSFSSTIYERSENKHLNPPTKNITFTDPRASEFYVDGTSIPEVTWDIGPSWSGLLPISNKTGETRKLFFWFFPPGPQGSLDDLIFWTNGGPGCSSLEGLLQENGPFSWSFGQAKPTQNEWSWTNISSMLYVEQPVGTGFSQGVPNIKDENDLAAQLVGFFEQFLEVFKEMKGKKFYLAGESYAGEYVPYIANYIYENPTALDLHLQGIWIADPVISYGVIQTQIPALDFVKQYLGVFAFDNATMSKLESTAEKCNYTDYATTYATYPPAGLLPLPNGSTRTAKGCDIYDTIFDAALEINPAFNLYRIFDMYPILWDVLGFPGSFNQAQTSPLYFDREDVKKAIHAPLNVTWSECANGNVFAGGDKSAPSSLTVLPNVIEKSNRTVIVNGLADYCILAGGTRIAIQNMTWAGAQGFHTPIPTSNFVVDGISLPAGNTHTERGLTYYEVVLSGHMVPQFSPWSAFQSMQYLLGQRSTP